MIIWAEFVGFIEETIKTIREGSGKHFDPDCVAAFERAWPRISSVMTGR